MCEKIQKKLLYFLSTVSKALVRCLLMTKV